MADPHADKVVLHLPFNEYTYTDILDCSPNKAVATQFGDATLSTAQFKGGTKSLYLDGTGDYLSLPNSAGYNFGAEDFTVECWVMLNALPTAGQWATVFSKNPSDTAGAWRLEIGPTSQISFGIHTGSSWYSVDVSNSGITAGNWYHIAITRVGVSLKVFVDGLQMGGNSTGPANITNMAAALNIGRIESSNTWYLNGYLDDLRITKGVARYTADFTPPGAIEYTIPNLATQVFDAGITYAPFAPPFTTPQPSVMSGELSGARNFHFGGRGRVSGTVRVDGATIDTPVYRRVRLFRDVDALMVAETWSDPVTGAYSFDYVDLTKTYTAISYDHTREFRAVAADNLTPTVIPDFVP